MEQTVATLCTYLQGELIGDGSPIIRGIASFDGAQEGEVAVMSDARQLAQVAASRAAAIVVPMEVNDLGGRPGIRVHNPKLAFARLLELFYPETPPAGGVHATVVLGHHVSMGEGVSIAANGVVGNHVTIGRGTTIASGVSVGDHVTIGEACVLEPHVVIYHRTRLGDRVRIHGGVVIGGDGFGYVFHGGAHVKVPQVGTVIIEDDVEIGSNACVDRATLGATIIRRGTKLDNLVQIAHNDVIGEDVIIAGQVGLSGSVTVGNHVMFGGQAGVVDHVRIGDRARMGAGTMVTKDVKPDAVMWWIPARPATRLRRELGGLTQLPRLIKEFRALLKQVRAMGSRLESLEQLRPGTPSKDPKSS